MSEIQTAKSGPGLLKWAIGCFALIGVAAVLYVIVSASFKPKEAQTPEQAAATAQRSLSGFKAGSLADLDIPVAPRPAPAQGFTDADGKPVTLADFKGQVVVVNLWASWCAPCKTEMPTLARLQAAYQTQPVKVLAISVDRDSDLNLARAEIAANPPLALYRDPGYRLAFALEPRAQGFPTTILYDRAGRERARLSGDADWSSPEARGLIEALIKE